VQSGPTYFEFGLINLFLVLYSKTWELQPDALETTNIGVNNFFGIFI